jgi:putative FmdB family regulatory protein
MPIYAYRCESCGHAKDVLQKMSDAPLTVCPACGADSFRKQVTAAGFQLKGSGWYVTDFRGGNTSVPPVKSDDSAAAPAKAAEGDKPAAAPAAASAGAGADSAASKPAAVASPAPAPAAAKPTSQGSE